MADEAWTVRRILNWTCGYLERKGDEHPRLSAEWLLSNACGLSRVELYMSFDRPLLPHELDLMRDAVRRRGAGEPLQYVTGEMPFRHIVLRCERGVLIPRPETEVLVDAALEGVDAAIARGEVYADAEEHAVAREESDCLRGHEVTKDQTDKDVTGSGGEMRDASSPLASAFHAGLDSSPSDLGARELVGSTAVRDSDGAALREDDPKLLADFAVLDRRVAGPGLGAAEDEVASALDGGEPRESVRKPLPTGPRVLEVGTGTGCIALSIAGERPGTCVWATDLSEVAVRLACRNRDALGLGDFVRIRACDLASGVPDELMGTFSVLVSNPPYIPSAVVPTLPFEVQGFEPGLALDGGPDGLDVFRRLLALAPHALTAGGMLCVELFEDNVHMAAELTRAQGGWEQVEVREDLTHRPRVLVALRMA